MRLRRLGRFVMRVTTGVVLAGTIDPARSAVQQNDVVVLPGQLPRQGYEQKTIRFGATSISSDVAVSGRYDSNIFATSTAPRDDVVVIVTPRINLDTGGGRFNFHGGLFGDFQHYTGTPREDRDEFGLETRGSFSATRDQTFSSTLRVERVVESRNDPEADTNRGLKPRRINAYAADLAYRYQPSHLAVDLKAGFQRYDYLPATDADRTLDIYRVAARPSLSLSDWLAVYLEPYAIRRNNATKVDRNGVDRDTTTVGATAGVRFALTGKLSGEGGLGVFRANPDDRSLRSFSGLGFNADLYWSLRPRTTLTLQAFRGDVATVQTGAAGRVDSRVGLRLDQEIRHNLLFTANASYLESRYRGTAATRRTTTAASRVEYLFNRFAAIFAEASYTHRAADIRTDRFDRSYVGIGLRLRH